MASEIRPVSGVIYELDDFPNPHPNGIGLTFNHIVWRMLRLHPIECRVNIIKPSNPYRCALGHNPWDYYFDQPPATDIMVAPPDDGLPLAGNMDWSIKYQRALNRFVTPRIRLNADIQAAVDSFARQNFKGRVLGIHLRGTDKIEEYQPMLNRDLVAAVRALVERLKPNTIFLHTDDIEYWKLMQQFSPVSLNLPRSKNSMHHHRPQGGYEAGKSAVMDGFLAAMCDWYAYTPSNMATIGLIMGRHEEIHRLNSHCRIDPFPAIVDECLGGFKTQDRPRAAPA